MAMSESYKIYLNSPEWAKIKADIISIRGRQCEYCGKSKGTFQVHHLTYKRIFKEEPGDLVLLCQACHAKQHPEHVKKARRLKLKAKKAKDTTSAVPKKKKISQKKKNAIEINIYLQALTMAVSSGKGFLPRVEGVFHTEMVNGAVRLVIDL